MPVLVAARSTSPATKPKVESKRDRVVDLVRAGCLIIAVGLHAFMAGISVDGGQLSVTDATKDQPWFAVLTWLVQIMPLFFIVGGFANVTQWRRIRGRGATAVDYMQGRLARLARPAVITFAAIAAGFGVASLLGVPSELLAEVGYRMGQPMWFLGVYLGVSAVVPIMVRLHESAPRRTIAALCGAALLIDLLRFATDIEAIGFVNLAFVWLAIQQLGFCYADGWFRRIDRRLLPVTIAASLGLLIMIIGYGSYSPNLIDNLNPPTVCLILLGLAQAFALTLATPVLERCAARPVVSSIVDAINTRAMTIYLWHMSVLVIVALIMLAIGLPFPEPLSAAWWFTRGYWLIAIAIGMIMAAQALGRFERGAGRAATRITDSLPKMIIAVLIAIAAVVTVLIAGFSVVSATLAAVGLAMALGLTRRGAQGAGCPGVINPDSYAATTNWARSRRPSLVSIRET